MKLILGLGALSGAIAATVGLYFLFVRPVVLTATLASLNGQGLQSAEVRLQFSNEGRSSLSISEVELFFTDSSNCTGIQIGRRLLQIGDEEMPNAIEPGKQEDLFVKLDLNLENEVRYAFCASFEVFTGRTTIRNERIALHEFSTIWNEFDSTDLQKDAIDIVRTRDFGLF